MNSPEIAPDVGQLILTLRGQRVILDSDLAKLYGLQPSASMRRSNATGLGSPTTFSFNSRKRRSKV